MFGDSITTDHISPAGAIKAVSPAGKWLLANNVGPIKYFAGYSGWGKGQLDNEIRRANTGEPVDNFDLELVTTSGDRITVSAASITAYSSLVTAGGASHCNFRFSRLETK